MKLCKTYRIAGGKKYILFQINIPKHIIFKMGWKNHDPLNTTIVGNNLIITKVNKKNHG